MPTSTSITGFASSPGTAVLPTWWIPPTVQLPLATYRQQRPLGFEALRPRGVVSDDADRLVVCVRSHAAAG